MSNYKVRKRNQKALKIINGTSTACSLFVGAVVQLDLNSPDANWDYKSWKVVVEFIKNHAPTILGIAALLIVISFISLRISRSAVILNCVETKLDVIRDWLCCEAEADYIDNHRVTLFQHKAVSFGIWRKPRYWALKYFPWSWEKTPFSGWLVPVARSGYTNQKPKAAFWAPDEGRKAEGIAGVCWATKATVHRDELPLITSTSSDLNKGKYCKITGTPKAVLDFYIDKNKIPARSFLSFPILGKDGLPWGVVVIDSQSKSGISTDDVHRAVSVSGPVLAVLLEEL
ncbi:hypothetical protein AB6E16_08890 [Vibrio atlanticus]|uniref:hypothetical protein n=1 Tax=Vibrio atlanticus TaxID=693153 RepID=UPI00355379B6